MANPPDNSSRAEPAFAEEVDAKVRRKLGAHRSTRRDVWSGLGMMGMVGWSVVVPTLLGAGLGIWLDDRHPGGRSWTLALLIAGLALGCFNAWHWVSGEDKKTEQDEVNDDE